MTNVGYATLDVIPSMKGFQSSVTRGVDPAMSSAGKRAGDRFGTFFKSAAKVGILGGIAAAAGAIKLGASAIDEAREAQQVARQTAAVIKSTGGAAKLSAKDVSKLAGRLSYMAGVDDELIQAGENVLLTFKDVRNEAGKGNKIFDKATKVALNMSTALGTDLKGANIQVGKALNDPIKGVTALTRVGVTFTDQQKDQIKTLVESGDKLAAQKLILKELGSEFGGSARSQASASDRLKVAFGNVQESLGKGLLPIVQDFSRFLLREGVPAAQEFSDWFNKKGIPAIKDLGKKLRPLADELLPAAADAFKSIKGFAQDALPFAEGIVGAFNDMPGWVKKVLIGGVAGGFAAKKLGLGSLASSGAKAAGGGLFAKGSTPANPLYVLDVTKGLGSGKLGAGSKVLGALGKGGLLAAFGISAALATKQDLELLEGGIKGALQGGGRGTPFGGEFKGEPQALTWAEKFGTIMDDNEDKIFANKQAIEEFGQSVRTRIPRVIETKFTLLGIDVANSQINGMFDTFIARNTRMQAQFSGDGGSTQPPNRTPDDGKVGPAPATRGGVTINIGEMKPHDYKEFTREVQRRSIAGAGNGWG
jgi:hypothetical protein